jgi:transcription antitermination factor NusG
MSQKDYDLEPRWYVVHTYSGYENKVKTDLEKTIKNRELQDFFFDIIVPILLLKDIEPWHPNRPEDYTLEELIQAAFGVGEFKDIVRGNFLSDTLLDCMKSCPYDLTGESYWKSISNFTGTFYVASADIIEKDDDFVKLHIKIEIEGDGDLPTVDPDLDEIL